MGRFSRGALIAAITVVLGGLASVFILHPFTPGTIQDGLDASWVAAMADGADRHARWGVDLAFTYGPATPLVVEIYNAAYFTHTLPLLLGFAGIFGLCAAILVARPGRSRRAVLLGALAVGAAIVGAKGTTDTFFLTLPFLVFLVAVLPGEPSYARRVAAIAGGFAMGLTAMAKMSFPLAALPLFLIADVSAVVRRRLPLLLLPFAVGIVAGDLLYGQRLGDLPAYVALQGQVVAGYSAGMVLPGPVWDLGAFLVLGSALVGLGLWAAWRDKAATRWAWLVPLGLAIDLVFLFKAGFVRHDLHSLIAWRGLVVIAVAAAVGWLLPRHRRLTIAVTAGAMVVAFVYEPVFAVRQSGEKPRGAAFARVYGGWLTDGPPEEFAAAFALVRDPAAFAADLKAATAEARAAIVEQNPLGPLPGTVDIVPSFQSRILAAGLDYHPRPSFQEYSTYTEGLAQANRAFVEGPSAPDWILFGPEPGLDQLSIDGRYPNLAEGAIWPDLLKLYRPDHRIGSLVALKRRAEPASLPIGPVRTVMAGFDVEVPVSADPADPVWATIDARLNVFGQIAQLLFRPPLPGLVVRLDDGETRRFRFVPALGRAGLILSPLVLNATEFVDLAEGRPADRRRRVVAVSLDASRIARAFYAPDVRYGFSTMQTQALGEGSAGPEPTGSVWDRLLAGHPGGPDPNGRVSASAPSMNWIPAEGLHHLTLTYGIDDGAWREAQTSGVCFAIYAADVGAPLWRSCLDPLSRAEDRGPHAVSVDLPSGPTEIGLQTTCNGACGAGWAYWTKPDDAATGEGK